MQNAVNFYSKVTANIRKKEDIYREDFFFLSMDSVIFANNSNAMAAINPIAQSNTIYSAHLHWLLPMQHASQIR
jgi:hypothetical protein